MSGSDPVSKTVSTLQSAYSLAKNIADLNETHAIKTQIGELQAQILSAQESALRSQERESALARRVDELEKRIAQMEAWDTDKKRYELKDFGAETFAYLLKPGIEGKEPSHRLCANCFQSNKKSILQFRLRNAYGQDHYVCPGCKTDFYFGERGPAPVITTRGPRGGTWGRR